MQNGMVVSIFFLKKKKQSLIWNEFLRRWTLESQYNTRATKKREKGKKEKKKNRN